MLGDVSGQSPVSGRDVWLASVRERMRRQRDQMLGAPPFPVWGLSSPDLRPYAVDTYERDSSGWRSVTVRYGGDRGPSDPAVAVRTALPQARRSRRSLAELLDASGWCPGAPPPVEDRTTLVVQAEPFPATLVTRGASWAARTTRPLGLDLVVIARSVPVAAVWLAEIDDLAAYWANYRSSAMERLPWAVGLDAHRAVVELVVRDPSVVPALTRRHPTRWRRAVHAQRDLAAVDRATAARAVRSLAEHVAALVEHAQWFTERELRTAAVEETLRYVGYGEKVASRPAQEAWERLAERPTDDARLQWLLAWSRWSVRQATTS